MNLLAAAILGVIQGLTEFLPISSSAHLILVPWMLGWKPEGLAFDVALHLGTAVAILAYFWRDWALLARETVSGLLSGAPFGNPERRLAWFLVVGTVPAALVGLAFEKQIEESMRSPLVTVVTLAGIGLLLYYAEKRSRLVRTLDQFTLSDAIWIGFSQALALIPGVSRSGITMSCALLRNSDRTSAARFSFLLATPIIVGAGVLEMWRFLRDIRLPESAAAAPDWGGLAVGVAVAAVTGFLCIRYFLRYLQSRTFVPFVIYRMALAGVVLTYYFISANG